MGFSDPQGAPFVSGRSHFFGSINTLQSTPPGDQFVDMLMTITPKTEYVRIQATVSFGATEGPAEIRGLKDGVDIQPDGTTCIFRTDLLDGTLTYDYVQAVTPNVAVELGVTMRDMDVAGVLTVTSRTLTLTELTVGTYTEEEDVGGG